jgi:molybdenum cofactor cytidylyltransferase
LRVAAVVLAAGASTRFGEPKQLALLGGERLLERAVRIALEAGCEPVMVVLGARAAEIEAGCELRAAKVVLNEAWAEGMASSVRAGLGALLQDVSGIVLMTCDQPAVTAGHLRKLTAAGESAATRVTAGSSYAGRVGAPAFFPVDRFSELMGLRGDQGARSLLQASLAVELPGGELDIDTVESLEAARQRYG